MRDELRVTDNDKLAEFLEKEKKGSVFYRIVNDAFMSIVITDHRSRIVYVNKQFERTTGYSFEEVKGQFPSILSSGKTPQGTYQKLYEALNNGRSWSGSFINCSKDGEEFIEEALIYGMTFSDSNGNSYDCFIGEKKDITLRVTAEKKIDKLLNLDNLTGAFSRSYVLEEANNRIQRSSLQSNHFTILFLDLNNFKEINDLFGHAAGDIVLCNVVKRLMKFMGSEDILGRVGGDEFIILKAPSDTESLLNSVEQYLGACNQPVKHNGVEIPIGLSIGSATWPIDAQNLSELLTHADIAMYSAKKNSSGYCAYNEELGRERDRENAVVRRLKCCNFSEQFYLVYQPIVDLTNEVTVGYEVLLRCDDDELGQVLPVELIQVAEKNNLMYDIGCWVVEKSFEQYCEKKFSNVFSDSFLSINISVQQLEHPQFYKHFNDCIKKYQVDVSRLQLEVTETLLITNPEKVKYILKRMVKRGMTIAIDDFGTGYSSLSYLKSINASRVKIDRVFIGNITESNRDWIIVKSTIDMCHSLGLSVIAEGVETTQQYQILVDLGCDKCQGYYYQKPQRIDYFYNQLENQK